MKNERQITVKTPSIEEMEFMMYSVRRAIIGLDDYAKGRIKLEMLDDMTGFTIKLSELCTLETMTAVNSVLSKLATHIFKTTGCVYGKTPDGANYGIYTDEAETAQIKDKKNDLAIILWSIFCIFLIIFGCFQVYAILKLMMQF